MVAKCLFFQHKEAIPTKKSLKQIDLQQNTQQINAIKKIKRKVTSVI